MLSSATRSTFFDCCMSCPLQIDNLKKLHNCCSASSPVKLSDHCQQSPACNMRLYCFAFLQFNILNKINSEPYCFFQLIFRICMHVIWYHSYRRWLTACSSSGNWFLQAYQTFCSIDLRLYSHRHSCQTFRALFEIYHYAFVALLSFPSICLHYMHLDNFTFCYHLSNLIFNLAHFSHIHSLCCGIDIWNSEQS